jgi:hypothetical protein
LKLIYFLIFNLKIIKKNKQFINIYFSLNFKKINGDWGLGMGIGDWGLGIGPNPQSPIPNPQSPLLFI